MSSLKYRPLDASRNELRLLTILPSSSEQAKELEPIHCALETFSLDDYTTEYEEWFNHNGHALRKQNLQSTWENVRHNVHRWSWGDYHTLSYVWGNPKDTVRITVNGHSFQATKNLEAALRTIRSHPCSIKGMKLWVDAICINQNDVVERSIEVRRMRVIFESSFGTFAWLGPGTLDSSHTLAVLTAIAEVASNEDNFLIPFKADSGHVFRDVGLFLWSFVTLPYWSRLWIVQEIALSHNRMELWWGEDSISWSTVASAFTSLKRSTQFLAAAVKETLLEDHPPVIAIIRRLQNLINFCGAYALGQGSHSLPLLLDITRRSTCYDVRDKVYGILGLIDPSLADRINPDYNLEVHEIYAEFTKATISITKSLDILLAVSAGNMESSQARSWVPDFSRVSSMSFSPLPYNASRERIPDYSYGKSGYLYCKGFQIDEIENIACGCSNPSKSAKHRVELSTAQNCAYATENEVREALWRTLVGDRERGKRASKHNKLLLDLPWFGGSLLGVAAPDPDMIYLKLFDAFQQCNRHFKLFGRNFWDYFNLSLPIEGFNPRTDTEPALHALRRQFDQLYLRVLVTTKNGYLGVAPLHVQQGDRVCVLLGCSMPVVLRPRGDGCILIGESYIHGVMDGEAMEWLDAGKCKLETITLC
jgi:hypothetical protein